MPQFSIARLLADHAARAPERPALTHEGRTLSRAALEARTNRLARAFAARGVREGRMVTIALANGIAFYEAAIAAWKLGAIPQPVSARLPQVELLEIVALAEPALVVGGPDLGGAFPQWFADTPDPDHESDAPLPERVSPAWKAPTSGGSTGRPKLIVSGEAGRFDPDQAYLGMEPDMVHLVPGPLYHNAPFAFSARGLFMGHHVVIMSRFDALETLHQIEVHGVNWLMLVPTMMLRIWRLAPAVRESFDLSSIRLLWHLAAPCPPWLKDAWIDWLGPERIWELYAGTEAQGTTRISGAEWLAHRGSVGKASPGFSIRILDGQGRDLPPGEIGEIFMRPDAGPGTTYRYIGAEPRQQAEGYESLGDMGYLDEDGYLYLADRRTDMILSGGANVYPAEVEAAIDAHPAVRSSAVIGLPDEDLGQRVHAIVDATEPVDEAALLAFLAERLVRYKIPRTVEFVDAPVRDDAGKVRRSALRQERLPERE